MAERKYLDFVELDEKAYPTVKKQKHYERAQALWKRVKGNSRLYKSQVLELKTKAAKARTSIMAHQQKKKEGESSNTLQSDGNKPTYSKEADEVITVNGKKNSI